MSISKNEEIILATIWRLQDEAYGIAINEAISSRTGLNWRFGSIYTPLGRLVKKGYLRTREGEPTPERGGRRKIYFELTDRGKRALREAQRLHELVWDGLLPIKFE